MQKSVEILLVEDNPAFERVAVEVLSKIDIVTKIQCARSEGEALSILRREGQYSDFSTPDIVVLDLTLGGQDGRGIWSTMTVDSKLSRIPVIILPPPKSLEDTGRCAPSVSSETCSKGEVGHRFCEAIRLIEEIGLKLIQNSSAATSFNTAPGVGCEIQPARIATAVAPSTTLPVQPVSETILLVEDEVMLKQVMGLILRRLGYQVYEAATAAEALELWQHHHETIDLVVTDLSMPDGVSGRELAAIFRLQCPKIPIVFSSGFDSETNLDLEQMVEGENFLPKPFQSGELSKIVRRSLDNRLT